MTCHTLRGPRLAASKFFRSTHINSLRLASAQEHHSGLCSRERRSTNHSLSALNTSTGPTEQRVFATWNNVVRITFIWSFVMLPYIYFNCIRDGNRSGHIRLWLNRHKPVMRVKNLSLNTGFFKVLGLSLHKAWSSLKPFLKMYLQCRLLKMLHIIGLRGYK